VGRHTSRLKPRTSTGRVIDSSPFSLVRGDANQRRETPENSTLGSLLLYYLVLALVKDYTLSRAGILLDELLYATPPSPVSRKKSAQACDELIEL
jgi:hypothetical protein